MIVIPSPLTADINELKSFLTEAEGKVDIFQIDINDGTFLNNKSVLPESLRGIITNLQFDFHLMVVNPIDWIERCVSVRAKRIIGQIEYMASQSEFVKKCQDFGVKKGLALDINTDISKIDREVLPLIDVILLMDYPAGVGGQAFDDRVLEKIKNLIELRKKEDLSYHICCDGGINEVSIIKVKEAGADEVTVGKQLFTGDFVDNISKLIGINELEI